ncbi:MAG: phenylalanine--tRNA ligase subunit beta [Dethiobacter sp.]|jgi:phenylalanyl-tRNA synthetase beta chain|nr:phenylalanine--tRNA ligase subunit beta [Dethiobacter sp.]
MRVPYTWLKDFIDLDISAVELAELLTRSGIEVDEVFSLPVEFNGVTVVEVLNVASHPAADKLFVVDVSDGKEKLTIVAGIDNMQPGNRVPLAAVGAQLPGGITIKRTKLRGVESDGMLCSASELGLQLDPALDGILILDDDAPVGMEISQALRLDDPILLLGLTPNRADCLGLLGVAHEVAALTGGSVQAPDTTLAVRRPVNDVPRIEIEDSGLCARYTGLVITGAAVRPSPLWMQIRLLQAGIRPISNIVDVTNYVMWEWGQPLHAFDYDTLADRTVVVRPARYGEKLVTLDKSERSLTPQMLVIADSVKPVGLAGVMGGLETEITEKTSTVLLESACFNPVSIRRTGRALGLYSEAQQRFERGVDVNGCAQASRRAARLIELLEAGQVEGELIDQYVAPSYPRKITLRTDRARKLIGLDISQKEMAAIFRRQGFLVEEGSHLHVTVPSRRADLQEEVDLIEEIARIYGYDKIGTTLPAGEMTQGRRTRRQHILKKACDILVACGYSEVINYSFISPQHIDKLRIAEDDATRRTITIANPLSEEQSVMRTGLTAGLLDTVAYNHNRNQQDLRLFELGAVYLPYELPLERLPEEKTVLGMAVTGVSSPEHWRHKAHSVDFFDLKGAVEILFNRLGINGAVFRETEKTFCQPGVAAAILAGDVNVGWIGGIHPGVLESFGLDKEVFVAELDMERLLNIAGLVTNYVPLPRFPALLRDLAVVVPDEVTAEEVQAMISEAAGVLAERVELFDLYRGPQIAAGSRSLAFAVTFRDPARTLSDEDVALLLQKIEKTLSERLGASLRS